MKAINGLMAYDCAGVDESVDDDGRWLMMNKTELGELKYAEFGLSLRIPLCLPAFFFYYSLLQYQACWLSGWLYLFKDF